MDEGLNSCTKVKIYHDYLEEIWALDPRNIDSTDGAKLSSYAVALSQYLIYYRVQRNKTKAEVGDLNARIDRTIVQVRPNYNKEVLKSFKTKSDLNEYIINTNECLLKWQEERDKLLRELQYTEGIDKAIEEFIATLKRELTRRENELYHIRAEYK